MFDQRREPRPAQTENTPTRRHPINTFITTHYRMMFGNSPPERREEAPQEWVPVPNELEYIIGDRCTYGKYIICISCNEFDPQRGKVKYICQRYFKYVSFKEHMTTYYHQVNTDINQAKIKRLNNYIIENECYPPRRKKQVPLSTFVRKPLDQTL